MANKTTTLHPLRKKTDNLYPNVLEDNIPESIQRKLTAGDNITITADNVISADTYTKEETDAKLDLKLDTSDFTSFANVISPAVQNLSTKVTAVEDKTSDLANEKQDMLTDSQISACNSGITSAKVSTYDGYATTIAGKQGALTTTQLNACNSGITASKVSTYDGYSTKKQDKLVSGTNIKTINNESILGSGNITISGGGGDSAVGTITLTDSQMYSLQTTGKCTLTSDNLSVIKSSKMVDIEYNSIVFATMSVNMMVLTSTLETTPVFVYHAYSIVWSEANYPLMYRIVFTSTATSTTFNFGEQVDMMIANCTYLNTKAFTESNDNIYGPQFYQHDIYMLYESNDTTFCVRFQIINNVRDQYTSITSLQNYLGTNFVQGCSGYMTSSDGYGNAYSVTASKVSGIVGTAQTSITYTTTGLTITDTIKEMS